jgi:hypothetical protein
MPVILAQEAQVEGPRSRVGLGKSERPYLKNKLEKQKDCGVTHVVDWRCSKCKALSSNPCAIKKNATDIFMPPLTTPPPKQATLLTSDTFDESFQWSLLTPMPQLGPRGIGTSQGREGWGGSCEVM